MGRYRFHYKFPAGEAESWERTARQYVVRNAAYRAIADCRIVSTHDHAVYMLAQNRQNIIDSTITVDKQMFDQIAALAKESHLPISGYISTLVWLDNGFMGEPEPEQTPESEVPEMFSDPDADRQTSLPVDASASKEEEDCEPLFLEWPPAEMEEHIQRVCPTDRIGGRSHLVFRDTGEAGELEAILNDLPPEDPVPAQDDVCTDITRLAQHFAEHHPGVERFTFAFEGGVSPKVTLQWETETASGAWSMQANQNTFAALPQSICRQLQQLAD